MTNYRTIFKVYTNSVAHLVNQTGLIQQENSLCLKVMSFLISVSTKGDY
jgi:hypothetical protein